MPYGLLLLSFLGTCSLQAGLGQSAGLGLGEAQLRYAPLRRTPRNGCPNGLRCRRTLPKSRMKGRKWDGRKLLPHHIFPLSTSEQCRLGPAFEPTGRPCLYQLLPDLQESHQDWGDAELHLHASKYIVIPHCISLLLLFNC